MSIAHRVLGPELTLEIPKHQKRYPFLIKVADFFHFGSNLKKKVPNHAREQSYVILRTIFVAFLDNMNFNVN